MFSDSNLNVCFLHEARIRIERLSFGKHCTNSIKLRGPDLRPCIRLMQMVDNGTIQVAQHDIPRSRMFRILIFGDMLAGFSLQSKVALIGLLDRVNPTLGSQV